MDKQPSEMSSDARYCEYLTRGHARTFSIASLFLPAEKRRATYALYAFCRVADDLVDLAGGRSDRGGLESQLAAHRRGLDDAIAGRGSNAVFRELAWAIQRFDIPGAPLHELLDGVTMDVSASRWQDWPALLAYCEGVAGCVGEMCASVMGVKADIPRSVAVAHARALGVAMQLTNVLRDIGEDARRGRVYLPVAELAEAGLTPEQVIDGSALRNRTAWHTLMRRQVSRARHYYEKAAPGIPMLESDAQRCANACAVGYSRILDVIERNNYDSYTRRASLGWGERALVLGRCFLGNARFVPTASRHEQPVSAA